MRYAVPSLSKKQLKDIKKQFKKNTIDDKKKRLFRF